MILGYASMLVLLILPDSTRWMASERVSNRGCYRTSLSRSFESAQPDIKEEEKVRGREEVESQDIVRPKKLGYLNMMSRLLSIIDLDFRTAFLPQPLQRGAASSTPTTYSYPPLLFVDNSPQLEQQKQRQLVRRLRR